MKYFIYIILCKDNSLYTGITNSLAERYKKHSQGKGARYTKLKGVEKYLCAWTVENKSIALSIEHAIKKTSQKQKLEFIQNTNKLKTYYKKVRAIEIKIRRVDKKSIDKLNLL